MPDNKNPALAYSGDVFRLGFLIKICSVLSNYGLSDCSVPEIMDGPT